MHCKAITYQDTLMCFIFWLLDGLTPMSLRSFQARGVWLFLKKGKVQEGKVKDKDFLPVFLDSKLQAETLDFNTV